jgi:hypothetical protein
MVDRSSEKHAVMRVTKVTNEIGITAKPSVRGHQFVFPNE